MLESEHTFIESTQKKQFPLSLAFVYKWPIKPNDLLNGLITTYSFGLSTHFPSWIGSPSLHVEMSSLFGSPTERTG